MIESLVSLYDRELKSRFATPKGCSIKELAKLEKSIGYELPSAHRDFLLWMGHDKRGAFQGTRVFLDDIQQNREILRDLREQHNVQVDDIENVCVFFTHQGYQAAWYNLPAPHGNPSCFFFNESVDSSRIYVENSFTDFMGLQLAAIAECLK